MEEASVRRLNGLQLAFIGDTVYDLYARGRALEEHDESVRQLHRRAVARVNAAAQARAFAAVEPLFFSQCARIFLKQGRSGRDSRDYPMFCVFLSLVFQRGTPQVLQSVGKAVGRLNKQKLAELDDSVRAVYGRDRASLRMWERVREEAASASPILENLTNLFKWRKDKP